MSRGSKKVTVGYFYFLGFHIGIAKAGMITRIDVDGKEAWAGYGEQSRIVVDAPYLFGGEDREGGVAGDIDVLDGNPAQLQNDYLQTHFGQDIPAFRGFLSVVMRRMYVGMNPYLKPWSFKIERINKKTDGSEQWLPTRAALGTLGDAAVYFALDGSTSMDTITSNGFTRWENLVTSMNAILEDIRIQVQAGAKISVCINTFGNWPNERDFAMYGNVNDALIDALKDHLVTTARYEQTYFPSGMNLVKSFFGYTYSQDRPRIIFTFTDGEPTGNGSETKEEIAQKAKDMIDEVDDVTAYAYNIDLEDTTYSSYLSSDGGVPVLDGADPNAVRNAVASATQSHIDMNPVHIIRECYTEPWGMNYQETDIDDDSFTASAVQLTAEGMGMSLVWDRSTSCQDFIDEILRHIDAVTYVDTITGKIKLKLIRDDYDPATLITLGPDQITKLISYDRVDVTQAINYVTVKYWDAGIEADSTVSIDNPAMVQSQGGVNATTMNYPGFTNSRVAAIAAARDLKAFSSALLTAPIEANRAASSLQIGDVYKFEWPENHQGYVIMRVFDIAYGDTKNNRVKITATEDIYATSTAQIIAPEDNTGTDLTGKPEPATIRAVAELPYYELVRLFDQPTVDNELAKEPSAGYIGGAVGRSLNAINARMWVNAGAGYEEGVRMDFVPYGFIETDMPVEIGPTTITVTGITESAVITVGDYAAVNNEILRLDAIDLATGVCTFGRSVLDSSLRFHPAGSTLFFIQDYYESNEDPYLEGEQLSVKMLPASGSAAVPLDRAAVDTVTMQARAFRPYPPAQLKIDGEYLPTRVVGTFTLTWAHRNRIQQTTPDLLDYTSDSVTPEAGTTYTVRMTNEATMIQLVEITGISGSSVSITGAQIGESSEQMLLEIVAVREGYESLYAQELRFAYVGQSYDLQFTDNYTPPTLTTINLQFEA